MNLSAAYRPIMCIVTNKIASHTIMFVTCVYKDLGQCNLLKYIEVTENFNCYIIMIICEKEIF